MKRTNRNRHHRRRRLMIWLDLRNTLLRHCLEAYEKTLKETPPPTTYQAKMVPGELTPEQRAQRVAMPIVMVEVQGAPWPPYDPTPRMLEYVTEMLIRRPR